MGNGKNIRNGAIGIIVLLVAAALGIGTYQSLTAKQNAERFIAHLNEQLATGRVKAKFAYQRMESSGFLLNTTVRLINPSLAVDVSVEGKPDEPMHLEAMLDGSYDIKTDWLAHQYHVVLDGKETLVLTLGQRTLTMVSDEQRNDLVVASHTLREFIEWNRRGFTNPSALLTQIALAKLTFGLGIFHDQKTGAMLVKSEGGALAVTNRTQADRLDFALGFNVKSLETSQAYSEFIEQLTAANDPEYTKLGVKSGEMPFSAARAGKQDMAFEATVIAPRAFDPQLGQCPALHVELKKYDFRNNFAEIKGPASIELTPNGQGCHVALNYQLDFTATPALAAETQRFIPLMQQMMKAEGGLKMNTPPSAEQKIYDALPTVSTLGPIHFGIKLSGDVATDKGAMDASHVTLEELNLTHARWGIETTGAYDGASAKTEGKLTCRACNLFIGDVVTTATQIHEVAELYGAPLPPVQLGQPLVAALDTLLGEIGTKDSNNTITFALTTPAPGDMRLNEKPMAQVMLLVMQRLQPFLEPPPPAPPPKTSATRRAK